MSELDKLREAEEGSGCEGYIEVICEAIKKDMLGFTEYAMRLESAVGSSKREIEIYNKGWLDFGILFKQKIKQLLEGKGG